MVVYKYLISLSYITVVPNACREAIEVFNIEEKTNEEFEILERSSEKKEKVK